MTFTRKAGDELRKRLFRSGVRDLRAGTFHTAAALDYGTKMVACVSGGQIYTSTDSGTNWTARESNRSWQGVASSADGTKLVAGVVGGQGQGRPG